MCVEQLLKTNSSAPSRFYKLFCKAIEMDKLLEVSQLYNHGRMGGTGYLSILPVDQGIEHTAGSSFTPNPIYFDPENSIKLAMERDAMLSLLQWRFSPIFKKICT
jgi:hypothetical protein